MIDYTREELEAVAEEAFRQLEAEGYVQKKRDAFGNVVRTPEGAIVYERADHSKSWERH
jgi:hypothetical protein